MDIKELQNLIGQKLKEINYELISLKMHSLEKEKVLSIVIDRVEPIDMDAISEVSETINHYLDEIDPFPYGYTLDISSLGIEKPLKVDSLSSYIGRYVHVHITNPIDGNNIYEGDLNAVSKDCITIKYKIKTRVKMVDIKKENISKIRLAIKF